MRVKTLIRFREKDNYNVVHEVGSEYECTDERGEYLAKLGFVEVLKPKNVAKPADDEPKLEFKPKEKKNKNNELK